MTNARTDDSSFVIRDPSGLDLPPSIQIGFYDPTIPFNLNDFLLNCGRPPFYYTVGPQVTTETELQLVVQGTRFSDDANVFSDSLLDPSGSWQCSSKSRSLRKYTYYNAQTQLLFRETQSLRNSHCDKNSTNYNESSVCQFILAVQFGSELLSSQTSSHGTTALQILIDEGGILGGIVFLTWFFSIFVV